MIKFSLTNIESHKFSKWWVDSHNIVSPFYSDFVFWFSIVWHSSMNPMASALDGQNFCHYQNLTKSDPKAWSNVRMKSLLQWDKATLHVNFGTKKLHITKDANVPLEQSFCHSKEPVLINPMCSLSRAKMTAQHSKNVTFGLRKSLK